MTRTYFLGNQVQSLLIIYNAVHKMIKIIFKIRRMMRDAFPALLGGFCRISVL